MLILLPPSEGKFRPTRGKPLALDTLSTPGLTEARTRVLDALHATCTDSEHGLAALGLPGSQRDLVTANTQLLTAPTARADKIYTGVVYENLGMESLSPAGKRRASSRVAVASALFGVVRPQDRIPAYRLSAGTKLAGLGNIDAFWKPHVSAALADMVGNGLLVDLRSQAYLNLGVPDLAPAKRAVVRVLHEVNGQRKVVSHFNKATKGRIARALLDAGSTPANATKLAEALRDLGWDVETELEGAATRVDVIVAEV